MRKSIFFLSIILISFSCEDLSKGSVEVKNSTGSSISVAIEDGLGNWSSERVVLHNSKTIFEDVELGQVRGKAQISGGNGNWIFSKYQNLNSGEVVIIDWKLNK